MIDARMIGKGDVANGIFYTTIGAILGSFFNVVGLRVPKNESMIIPPSHCPSCEHRLSALDLVLGVFLWIIAREMSSMWHTNFANLCAR